MPNFIFANNVSTTLASPFPSGATSFTLSSIANLPTSIPSGSVLVVTLNDFATRQNFEIVYVGTIAGPTCSNLSRAQEGTAELTWLTGDFAYSPPTKGQQNSFGQLGTTNTWTGANTFSDPVSVGPATQPTDALQQQQKGFLSITTSQSLTVTFTGTLWVSGCGGGGGGGGVPTVSPSVIVPGSSGGGAGFPVLMTPIAVTVGDVLVITIGAAGVGGPNAVTSVGGTGGTTTIVRSGTTLLTLAGGLGGASGQGGADNQAWPGAAGGLGTPSGTFGQDSSQFGPGAQGGIGGSGPFGGGGPGGRGSLGGVTVPGGAAGGFGAGGGGAGGVYGSTGAGATGNTGGAGGPGLVLFQW